MDEDKKKVATTATPQVSDDIQEEEHVEEEAPATQPTSEAHVEEEESGTPQEDTTGGEWETEKKRLSSKISKLEKDLNMYKTQADITAALDSAAQEDPEFRKMANKKLFEKGLIDEATYKTLDTGDTNVQSGSKPDTFTPSERQYVQKQMQAEEEARVKFFSEFEERHPEVVGDTEEAKMSRIAIGAAAARKMAEGMSQAEAYEFAFKQIIDPQSLVEDGKLQGLAQAQTVSSTEGAASGGSASASSSPNLTAEQREAARLFGVKEENYAENVEE